MDRVEVRVEVSAPLKHKTLDIGARLWLLRSKHSQAMVNAAMRVMHPDLYNAGKIVLKTHRGMDGEVRETIDKWPSVFSGVSMISNRVTPGHRDTGGRYEWYDLLASVGPYENGDFQLPDLGLTIRYTPGSLLGVVGKLQRHAMPWFQGERICYAYFMKDDVHESAHVIRENQARYVDLRTGYSLHTPIAGL